MRSILCGFAAALAVMPQQKARRDGGDQGANPRAVHAVVQSKPDAKEPTAEDRLATYTGWLTGFTGVLAVSTIGLFVLGWRQGNQIQREFLSTHRPNLNVRGFQLIPERDHVEVVFQLVNVGETEATVIQSNVTTIIHVFQDPLPAPPIYGLDNNSMGKPSLSTGESHEVVHRVKDDLAVRVGLAGNSNATIHVFGYAIYTDARGTKRRFAFGRAYDPARKRFTGVGDPEYEYYD